MRRNRKNSIKKERIIMLASSAFVLAALTMTGIYMKEQNAESKDDGYTLDFTALENSADDKFEEIAQNDSTTQQAKNQVAQDQKSGTQVAQGEQSQTQIAKNEQSQTQIAGNNVAATENGGIQPEVTEDDLDYMPLEVGSDQVEIPGLTDSEENQETEDETANAQSVVIETSPSFSEADGLLRPVSGDILMHYSMDSSIYFATLDQYKYNPAVVFTAQEGTQISACAQGKVINIYDDAQIGKAVTLDLGNGYQATYGQLKDVTVAMDSYVEAGDLIGVVAAPTKYYSVEGSNLYFQLTKDGAPVNPENMFR